MSADTITTITADLGLMSLKDIIKPLPSGYKRGVVIAVPENSDITITDNAQQRQRQRQQLLPAEQTKTQAQLLRYGCSTYEEMFQKWTADLTTKVKSTLPDLSKEEDYKTSIKIIVEHDKCKNTLTKQRDDINKVKPLNQDSLNKVNQQITETETKLQNAIQDGCAIAKKLVDRSDLSSGLLSSEYNDIDLLPLTIMKEITINKLIKWCNECIKQANLIINFLNDSTLMRKFLMSGGAKNGEYLKAIQIYNQIQVNDNSNTVLQRLALAVSLELCVPLQMFHRDEWCTINPYQRYIHYEQAYLLGELDVNFSQFNVWELRHVINSDATNEELSWGRQSLINYRPDLINTDNPQWNYCMIVKTDVNYCTPDWYKEPKTFDQILAGGGKCGPRAWYGRFICKAFGIPTWGVKQPGHAAMTRWTSTGNWCTCLGAGFQYSYWEDEHGTNFYLSTQAMRSCYSEQNYMYKVRRIEWIGTILNEDSRPIRGSCIPSTCSLWWSLSYFQRHILAKDASTAPVFMFPRIDVTPNIYLTLKYRSIDRGIIEYSESEKTILIPAPCCTSPTTTTNKVLYFRSYLGGQQLYIKENGTIEYKLQSPIIKSICTKYSLICRVCTAHRNSKPITLVICIDGKFNHPIHIELPYTVCMWGETKPIIIELGGPNITTILLRFVRENEPFGFGIKDIKLTEI